MTRAERLRAMAVNMGYADAFGSHAEVLSRTHENDALMAERATTAAHHAAIALAHLDALEREAVERFAEQHYVSYRHGEAHDGD